MKKGKKVKAKEQEKELKKPQNSAVLSIVIGVATCWAGVYLSTFIVKKPLALDSTNGVANGRQNFNITCSKDYKDHHIFNGCTPTTVCGRIVRDGLFEDTVIDKLLDIAKRGFVHGGSSGGASILDLHSGALSKGDKFVNIYQYLEKDKLRSTFKDEDFRVYSTVKNIVQKTVAGEFGIDVSRLYLTHPTFFSRITNAPAKTMHDEYWHQHIDKIQYGSFDYTSLLYLTDHGEDFDGGRFIFDGEKELVVKPKKGRLSFFTSGSENPHHVEKVESGTRYAITISFTCDPKKAIKDPSLNR